MRVAVEGTYTGRIDEPEHPKDPVELAGELDALDLPALRGALDAAGEAGGPVGVDLSGVTFLDLGCAEEILVRLERDELEVRDASWQAEASFDALERSSVAPRKGWFR